MNWTELLTKEMASAYQITAKLFDLVDEQTLAWKPPLGSNWMTVGQLLFHLTVSCGTAFKGFITDDWGLPEDFDIHSIPPDEMLPPAEKLPALASVAEAKKLLAQDHHLALEMLQKVTEEELAHKIVVAPWDPKKMILGHRLLQMVYHLDSHKSQLFYYLKLLGKPVNTNHLWGE